MNLDRMRKAGFALVAALAAAPFGATAELPPDATELLKRSIAAHSRGPDRLRLVYRGDIVTPDQSARPAGPFRAHPWTVAIAIDESANALAFSADASIDGGFRFYNPIGFSDGRGFAATYTGEHYDEFGAFPAVADTYFPHRLLKGVLDAAESGALDREGAHDRLTLTMASGESRVLLFDRRTHLLAAMRRAPAPTVYGDQSRETIYARYRRIGGTMAPGEVNLRFANPIHGVIDRRLHLVVGEHGGPSEAELTPPPGATLRAPDPRTFETVELGRDVYLLRNVATAGLLSYNVLAVEFADHMLVVDASLDDATSERVMETVAGLAPGKEVRRLVQTHHHGDHIGGLRTYIAAGTTIIAPAGMRGLIDEIAATHSAVAPDALARSPAPARVEEVEGERRLEDARNSLTLYDLPSEHSAHMLVVYLPEQQVLFQGDLVSAGELPLNPTTEVFLAWLRERGLPVAALAGVHGRTLTGAELETLLREGRLASDAAAPAP